MSKIAIDIALLPAEEIIDKAIEINGQLVDNPIKLNKNNCLPHITLCMGVIDKKNLPKIKKIINEFGESFSKLSLVVANIKDQHTCFVIKKSKDLQKIHEEIMKKTRVFFSSNATVDMCYSPPPVVKKTLFWINGFRDNSSYENYYPHITLGTKGLKSKEINISFIASKIILCQLGNYCTCRKVLHSVILS